MLSLTVFALAVSVLATPATQAQDLQAGYILEQALIVNMPQYQQVQQQLQQDAQSRQQQMQQQMQSLQQKVKRYQQQQSLLSEEKRTQREQELRKLEQQLQQKQQQQQQQMMQKRQDLMQPLYESLDTALQTVSDEQGLDLVFRGQALAHVSDEVVNVTPAVAKELGIDVPEATEPEAGTPPVSSPMGNGE